MNRQLLYILKNKKDYYKYFMLNSFFIKNINRIDSIEVFEKYIKDKYRLKISDKINDAVDTVDTISTIIKGIV